MTTDPTSRPHVPLLVVGAGPVGLAAAHELTRRGLRVRIVDARDEPPTTSRAIATHPRTLEVYDHMGIVDEMLAAGRRITAFTLYQRGRRMTRLDADYSATPTRFPFTLAVDQADTERVLRGALARLGVEVEWGTRLAELAEEDGFVRARLELPGGAQELIGTPWLLGCDGGHSLVRKTLGVPLEGESAETWMLADAQVETALPADSIYWVRTGGVTLMAVPLTEPGRWRMLDTAPRDRSTDPVTVAERLTRMLSAGTGTEFRVAPPRWTSVFTFQQRMVRRMRVGRCLLVGDAAHVHSPASGQGMNTGIQEAYNLAWKLAMVVHGQASAGLLDSYTAERVPVGEALLATTKRATRMIQLKNPVADRLLPLLFGVLRTVHPLRARVQRGFLGGISGLNLHYGRSPLTVPSAGARSGPAPGERITQVDEARSATPGWQALLAELRDLNWTLLVFSGPGAAHTGERAAALADRHKDWLSVRTVRCSAGDGGEGHPAPLPLDPGLPAALGGRPGGWILVRPDAYVAARGELLDESALTEAAARAGLTPPD
ncbi:FAD-dependent oxidoreductase [Kitasatospora sp. NPDC093550]|uniref:FAD-dependent oxidoreductase n=1 Tax=Kitasatospora sp. NPDC093550 TaxID=3364089 RepID=UPI00381F8497